MVLIRNFIFTFSQFVWMNPQEGGGSVYKGIKM